MPNKVTIRDVARAAQVSAATVSRHLNKNLALPAATVARIEGAIASLDYRPNLLARNLSLGRSQMIGLVIPDIANPFFAQLASAAEEAAAARGYRVLLCSTQNDLAREVSYLDLLSGHQLDGLIFLTSHGSNPDLQQRLGKHARVVILDEDAEVAGVSKVFVENLEGAYAATEHLLARGHRPSPISAGRPGSSPQGSALRATRPRCATTASSARTNSSTRVPTPRRSASAPQPSCSS